MKNKIIIVGIMFFLILSNCITVFAETHSVTLQTEKTDLNQGETFKVKIKVSTPDGINGMVTRYNYDTKKLELIEKSVIDSNFTDLGGETENEIALMFNPKNPNQFVETTETDIYELTFKVKENATEKAKISFSETKLSTFSLTDSEHDIKEEIVEINIINEGSGTNWVMIIVAIVIVVALFRLISKRKK